MTTKDGEEGGWTPPLPIKPAPPVGARVKAPIPADPKFCRDCKHLHYDFFLFGHCHAPKVKVTVDLVTGKKTYPLAEQVRKTGGCGPDGRWFESKYKERT